MTSRAAALLLAQRDRWNRRFAAATARPDPAAMLAYLARTVVPIVDAWPAAGGDAAAEEALLELLFDLGLRGGPLGLVGADAPTTFEQALVRALPALAPLGAPATIVQALGNGALRVAHELGTARADWWLQMMTALGAGARTRDELFALGLVLAWCAGLAEAREAALAAFARFEPALRRAVFAEADPIADAAARFVAPGRTPGGALAIVGAAGGFLGFGGPFARPPRPAVVRERLVCTDGVVTCELHADAFGARLVPAAWAHGDAATAVGAQVTRGALAVWPDGRISVGGEVVRSEALVGATGIAAAQGMVAVTLADSHKVFVVGRAGR